MTAPSEFDDSRGEKASAPPDFTTERIPFWVRMSFTISASAGEPSLCSATKRASLVSCKVLSGLSRSTNCALSSAQCVIPGSYSASHIGQNIFISCLVLSFTRKRNLIKVGHAFESTKTVINFGVRQPLHSLRAKLLHIKRSHYGSKNHCAPHRTLIERFLARQITHEASGKRVARARRIEH